MYKGRETHPSPHYRDKYIPGIGTVAVIKSHQPETLYHYVCDHCGRAYAVLNKAAEPFYCDCQRLVSV